MTLEDLHNAIALLKEKGADMKSEVVILSDTDPLRVVDVVTPTVLLEKDLHKYKMVHLGFTKPMQSAGFAFSFKQLSTPIEGVPSGKLYPSEGFPPELKS